MRQERFREEGQALLELSIFGSILLMLLGVLLQYGLRFNYQQQLDQETFRKAMAQARWSRGEGHPTSVDYMVIRDEHIPDPSSPWGVGQMSALQAYVPSIKATYELDQESISADTPNEYPQLIIDINGREMSFSTSAWHYQTEIDANMIDRYNQLFGYIEGCKRLEEGSTTVCRQRDGWKQLEERNDVFSVAYTCVETVIDYYSGVPDCIRGAASLVRFMDPNAGQIVPYDNARLTCQDIFDRDKCEEMHCEDIKDDDKKRDCIRTCGKTIKIPWYCEGGVLQDGEWQFPVIDAMFDGTAQSMGLQPQNSREIFMDNRLEKTEDSEGIRTVDTLRWHERTSRSVIYHDTAQPGISPNTINEMTIETTSGQNEEKRASTSW
ncbi:MAG: hypothetical protein KKC84_00545 [Candidatus Omnitrophica bacterium]|nr:hypothetical protein [Candidatus Omnitrophota bacterium]